MQIYSEEERSPGLLVNCRHKALFINVMSAYILFSNQCRKIVKAIDIQGIDVCFVVGGNGGNAGAAAIREELERCGVVCSVIGVPKSIDNDILLVSDCLDHSLVGLFDKAAPAC